MKRFWPVFFPIIFVVFIPVSCTPSRRCEHSEALFIVKV